MIHAELWMRLDAFKLKIGDQKARCIQSRFTDASKRVSRSNRVHVNDIKESSSKFERTLERVFKLKIGDQTPISRFTDASKRVSTVQT